MLSQARQMQIRRAIARYHGTKAANALAKLSLFYLVGFENHDWEMHSNGEVRVPDRLLPLLPSPIVFDVGANVGDWSAAVLERSDATIHAFELVPDTARRLTERFAGDQHVHVIAAGLLDERSQVRAQHVTGRSTMSRILGPADAATSGATVEEVPVLTGDDHCAEHGIDEIDLLKVDAEGSDLRILRGFGTILAKGGVKAIQFEHGSLATEAGVRLHDFYALLEPLGYAIGKVYPRSVEWSSYGGTQAERFAGMNYLAIRREHRHLIDALSG